MIRGTAARDLAEGLGLVQRRARPWWPEDGPLVPLGSYRVSAFLVPVGSLIGLLLLLVVGIVQDVDGTRRPWALPALWLVLGGLLLWRRPGWFSGASTMHERYDDAVDAPEAPRARPARGASWRQGFTVLLVAVVCAAALRDQGRSVAVFLLAFFGAQAATMPATRRRWERERGRVLLVSRDRPFSGDVWCAPRGDAAARR